MLFLFHFLDKSFLYSPTAHSTPNFIEIISTKYCFFVLLLRHNCDKDIPMKLSIQLKRKDESEYYVYIGLSHKTSRTLITTPYTISSEYVKGGKIVNRAKYAEIYNKELLKYEEKLAKIVAPEHLDIKTIKDILTASTTEKEDVVEFFSNAEKIVAKIAQYPQKVRSARIYGYYVQIFKSYLGRDKLYTFEMTKKMMQGYIDHLCNQGKSPATITNYISAVKLVFNRIKDEYNDYDLGIINIKNDPFRKLQLPQLVGGSGHKALSVEDICKVASYKYVGHKRKEATYAQGIDYFMLSFYLLGINPVDMYNLKKEQYQNGRIVYSRRKTQRRVGGSEISIPVCAEAAELLERHKGKGGYLIDMHDQYTRVEGVVRMMARVLGIIHSLAGLQINKDNFTWYSARHTWASIAANECHFSDAEVARALNHQSEHKVTRGYIRPDWSLLDRMNEAVLAVINKAEAE